MILRISGPIILLNVFFKNYIYSHWVSCSCCLYWFELPIRDLFASSPWHLPPQRSLLSVSTPTWYSMFMKLTVRPCLFTQVLLINPFCFPRWMWELLSNQIFHLYQFKQFSLFITDKVNVILRHMVEGLIIHYFLHYDCLSFNQRFKKLNKICFW